MKGLCHNHVYSVKHALEDRDLLKRYLKGKYEPTGKKKLAEPADNKEKRDNSLTQRGAS